MIVVESDSQNLIKAMQSNEFDRAPEGIIYRDLRLYVRLNFNSVMFSVIPRTCNNLAHELAKYGAARKNLKLLVLEALPCDVRVSLASASAEPSV